MTFFGVSIALGEPQLLRGCCCEIEGAGKLGFNTLEKGSRLDFGCCGWWVSDTGFSDEIHNGSVRFLGQMRVLISWDRGLAGSQGVSRRVSGLVNGLLNEGYRCWGWRPEAGKQCICDCSPGKECVSITGGGLRHCCLFQNVYGGR